MTIKEIPGDLFTATDTTFMQCISADIACGAGIAVAFNQHFDVKNRIKQRLEQLPMTYWDEGHSGFAILEKPVINLVTKRRYFEKPTEETLKNALNAAVQICKEQNVKTITMPYIASGLDRMNWKTQVRPAIEQAFAGTDIDITVYKGPSKT